MSLGKLYLVPNKLGESKSNFPEHQQTLISSTKYFIFENEKPGRAFIKNITPNKNQSEINISIFKRFFYVF
jgi:16S rRNA C1402 (ribose-2'-O) methylase RsmI